MNVKTDVPAGDKLDTVKWGTVGLLVAAGIGCFYYFSQRSTLLGVLVMLALFGFAVFTALRTAKGRFAWWFLREAQTEVRKVVWPTRQETIQTTGMIILMVIIVSLLIWMIDSILFWLVQSLTS
jgi:preprotein translocase subunit SecE